MLRLVPLPGGVVRWWALRPGGWRRLPVGGLVTVAALVAAYTLAALVVGALGLAETQATTVLRLALVLIVPMVLVFSVSALGEEAASRGFLQQALAGWGFWRASAAVAAWVLFHVLGDDAARRLVCVAFRRPDRAAATGRGPAQGSHPGETCRDASQRVVRHRGPKSGAGVRDVAVTPHLLPVIQDHLGKMPVRGPEALLFPAAGDAGKHLAPALLYKVFYRAREVAGRPDLRWHDLRHTGAVLATQSGATLAELMGRLGHSTPHAALRYQHVAGGREAEIARALSSMALGHRA